MVNIIKAEHQKAKRTMRKKFIWGFPLLTFVMAFIFTLGMTNAYAESVWNWWYTLLLPGMIALFCYLSVAQEKKIKYYHLTTIPTHEERSDGFPPIAPFGGRRCRFCCFSGRYVSRFHIPLIYV